MGFLGRGEYLPKGVVLGADGRGTCNPAAMFVKDPSVVVSVSKEEKDTIKEPGCLLPFADHKGYGLSLMCELFGGLLSGGPTILPKHPRDKGIIINSMTTIIFDPVAVSGRNSLQELLEETAELEDYMRESPARPATEDNPNPQQPMVPGEIEQKTWEERMENGIPLSRGTFDELLAVCDEVGISSEDALRTLKLDNNNVN